MKTIKTLALIASLFALSSAGVFAGQGQGNGDCTRDRQQKQLRDGSGPNCTNGGQCNKQGQSQKKGQGNGQQQGQGNGSKKAQ